MLLDHIFIAFPTRSSVRSHEYESQSRGGKLRFSSPTSACMHGCVHAQTHGQTHTHTNLAVVKPVNLAFAFGLTA